MEYLIGMVVTFVFFSLMLWLNGRKNSKNTDKILEYWEASRKQSEIKNGYLSRITIAMERAFPQLPNSKE